MENGAAASKDYSEYTVSVFAGGEFMMPRLCLYVPLHMWRWKDDQMSIAFQNSEIEIWCDENFSSWCLYFAQHPTIDNGRPNRLKFQLAATLKLPSVEDVVLFKLRWL